MKNEIEAIVLEVIDSKTVKVKVSRHGECSNCGACPGENALMIEVYNPIGAIPGQRVMIESEQNNMLKAAFVVYILPLITTVIGSVLGYLLAQKLSVSETVFEIIGGFIFFFLTIVFIKFFEKSVRFNQTLPVITKVIV